MDEVNADTSTPINSEPTKEVVPSKSSPRKVLPYAIISVLVVFFLGVIYFSFIPTKNLTENLNENIPSQNRNQELSNSNVSSLTNDNAGESLSSFQAFLKQNCNSKQVEYGITYNVALDKTPFVLSEKTKNNYLITDQIGCFFSTDSSSVESGKGYLFVSKSRDKNNVALNKSELKLGDINSAAFGFEAHFLNYDKEIEENKQTLIYDKDGIKIVARGIFAGPYCPNDQNFWFELIAFKNLGDYRASVFSDYLMVKNPKLDKLIQQYGKPVVENDLNEASYEICGDAEEYERAVLNTFLPSYEQADLDLKLLMSEMINDLQQTTLR